MRISAALTGDFRITDDISQPPAATSVVEFLASLPEAWRPTKASASKRRVPFIGEWAADLQALWQNRTTYDGWWNSVSFKRGPLFWTAHWTLGPDPVAPSLFFSRPFSQKRAHEALDIARQIYDRFHVVHGYIGHSFTAFAQQSYSDRYGLPGVFWANLFGPEYVHFFGEATIRSAPAYRIDDLPRGGILLLTAPEPDGDFTSPARQVEDAVKAHLDHDAFADLATEGSYIPIGPDGTFDNRNLLVTPREHARPPIDLSALVRPPRQTEALDWKERGRRAMQQVGARLIAESDDALEYRDRRGKRARVTQRGIDLFLD